MSRYIDKDEFLKSEDGRRNTMREILFRGKRIDNGEWVEGSYAFQYGCHEILLPSTDGEYGFDRYFIYPETVGQFTGLTDRNGKKIFEGDVVRHYNNLTDSTKYEVGKVFWDKKRTCFRRTSNPSSVFMNFDCCYEVVGTIHDNPELLKDGE